MAEDSQRWRPRRVRGDTEAEAEYDALHDGVPPWLRQSLLDWVLQEVCDRPGYFNLDDVKWLERRLQLQLDWVATGGPSDLNQRLKTDDEFLLDVVDALLGRMSHKPTRAPDPAALSLMIMLHEAGSTWTIEVDEDNGYVLRLVRRVDESVVADARQAMERGTRAGQHLARAWNATFGRSPNASEAYREAVKAVEAAARPVVIPADPLATLGKVIAAMRDAPPKWHVLLDSPSGADHVETVIQMCETLWRGQSDRHGTDEANAPLNVTDKQAEAAVHLAVLLVQWFETGVISRI